MSRLKRQRLTADGDDRVTAAGDDSIGEAGHPLETPNENGEPAKKKEEQQRSLFVRSLPASTTTEALTTLFSDSYPLKHATVVIDPITKQSKGYGFVTFADVEDAQSAKDAFNGHLLDGKKISVELARPRTRRGTGPDNKDSVTAIAGHPPAKDKQDEKPPRLIVRNLPWTIKDADQLALLFRSFGKVKHAAVPKKGPGLSAGFGFVLLRGRKNAEKAMAALNGKEIEGRPIAVDWAVDKDTWQILQKGVQEEANQDELSGLSYGGGDSVKSEDDGGNLLDALPQRDHEYLATSEDDDDDDKDEVADMDDDDNDDEDDDEEEEEEHTDDKSSTLFIRNLPFTATDTSLVEHFKRFGGVRYARIVLDQATERSKGVGFVCFYREEDADACIRSAPQLQAPASQQQKAAGTTATKQSLLQDTSVDRSGQYTLEGRVLQISRAVDRKEATRLTFANSSLRETRDRDKRRLYLLAEGSIPSNSSLYNQLSPAEIKMREDSAKQRQSLIKTNPSLNLSLTRLSVRNLPRSIDSKALKALAREAAVGFAKDVKAGLRKQLTKEELSRGGNEMREAEQERKTKGKGIVRQAKIVFEGREGTKVAEDSGAGRSRGYGFIEYSSHRWALMGLRWLNAHAVESSKNDSGRPDKARKKRLIVEFAIENAQVVMRRQEKEAKARETSRIVQEKRKNGELPEKKKEYSKDQLMAKTRKGGKRKRKDLAEAAKVETKPETEEEKLAKRQQIIGRKRMLRRKTKGKA